MVQKPKIVVGMLHQETDTFNLNRTGWPDLDCCSGERVLNQWRGKGMPLSGAIAVFAAAAATLIPSMAVVGTSGGSLELGMADSILAKWDQALSELQPDAVYLDLHGALVGADMPDVSGALVERVSRRFGSEIPIAASFDCHANLTPRLIEHLDILVGYKTYPHTDYVETGRRAAALLLRLLRGEIEPRIRVVRIPAVQPPEIHDTATGPIAPLVIELNSAAEAGEILDGTIFPTQPWLDVPDLGSTVAVTTDGDGDRAESLARRTAEEWWALRAEFTPELLPPDEVVAAALEMSDSTVMVSESADAINSGAGGDNPALIRALVEHGGVRGLVFICDGGVVGELDGASGARRQVEFGRDCDRRFAEPFVAEVEVERKVPGRFRLQGPLFNGLEQDMHGAVVLRAGDVHILAGRKPVFCSEPNLYRCAGLEPADYKIVGIKSPSSFRPAFAAITEAVLHLDIGGVASPNLAALPWENVNRPLYPLDKHTACRMQVWPGRRG